MNSGADVVHSTEGRFRQLGVIGWIGHAADRCGDWNGVPCRACGSTAIGQRPERTAQGYRRSRCANRGKLFNERSIGVLNRAQYPSDVIALVVL
jgi:hypothetical protein